MDTGSRVQKATKVARGDATLRELLEQQEKWDSHLVEVIHSITPPEDFRKKLTAYGAPSVHSANKLSLLNKLGILAVILGLLVFVGLGIMYQMDRREQFQGREVVGRMLDVTRNMRGTELDPVTGESWQLSDWFYMRGFEGFSLPPEVAKLHAVGSRVLRQGGMPIAQIAVDDKNTIVFVFRAADFSVDLPEDGKWLVFDHEGWAAAIRRHGPVCTMLSFRGEKREMREFIRSLESKE